MLDRVVLLGVTLLWLPGATLLARVDGERAVAGEAGVVAVGTRVRVTPPETGAEPLVGQVVALEPGVVVVRGDGGGPERRVPLGSARSFEMSAGTKSLAGRGAMIGAAFGAMPGLLMNVGDYDTDKGNPAVVSIAGAAAGAALGALIGWALKSEDWRPAMVPAVTAGIAPIPRGASISFRVMWGRGGQERATR